MIAWFAEGALCHLRAYEYGAAAWPTPFGFPSHSLVRRVTGLRESAYIVPFLAHVPQNAGLIATAEAYGLIPPDLEEFLAGVTRE